MFIYNIPLLLIIILSVNAQKSSIYTIEQALLPDTQFKTLAFDGLSFITGNLCSDSFIPPGKVADYFGFQHLRDNTPNGEGHNTDFLTYLAFNVMEILTDAQIQIITDRAEAEVEIVNDYATNRYPLMVAFRRQLEGEIPTAGSLNQDKVMQWSSNTLYKEIDAEISINRAYTFSQVIKSLTNDQLTLLNDMKNGGFITWTPMQNTTRIDKREFDNDEFTLIMTYCSEMFSWFAGDTESDTYFCPERQANYFGSFYVKDAPAINNPGYKINESLTAMKGEMFANNILNAEQRVKLESLVLIQNNSLYNIVTSRRHIANELRLYLNEGYDDMNDIDIDLIYDESEMYGNYDGYISYYYTMIFTEISNDLTSIQLEQMDELTGLGDEYICPDDKIYKYSTKLDIDEVTIENTDFFFIDSDDSEPICQTVLQFEGGSDDSDFINNLEWIKVNDVYVDGDYYFMSETSGYYLYQVADCRNGNWWIITDISDVTNLDKPICDLAIGRCRRSDIIDCDGQWGFKNNDGRGHTLNAEVKILLMHEICQ